MLLGPAHLCAYVGGQPATQDRLQQPAQERYEFERETLLMMARAVWDVIDGDKDLGRLSMGRS
ncbi:MULTISPECIES: hypothetical protein [unclassified Nonomuraea]|uniref:hypothetical protein n=1 Tax=unclassified Nonomuraea TaxID=2593643 RepID=UPI001378F0AF|nr:MULTISPECIES: hypothetical protein [unclassified Nonomuraea]NBE93971.1 hypothetical protein [Nonomuraea sp. K271]